MLIQHIACSLDWFHWVRGQRSHAYFNEL